MKQNLANDAQFNKKIADYYQRAVDQINRTIDENAALIVDKNGNHTGYQPVTAGQMASYQREAKHVVEQANQLRTNGKTQNYGNWTDEANRRMRVYNATMRINRLELLKSQIGLHLTEANVHIDADLTGKLSDDYIKECQRQAGIMGDSMSSFWTGTRVAKVVMAQTNSATFSQRLWANQDALKAKLDQVIANGVIQGQNPVKMARKLKSLVKDTVNNQRYVTERIARTESARVQFSAQMDSIKANGYEYVQWFAEIKACPECAAIERKDNGYGPGVYKISKVPEIPVHPNCRCSISETVLDDETQSKYADQVPDNQQKHSKTPGFDLNSINSVRAFNKAIRENLGIKTVRNMTGIEPKYLQEIYSSLSNNLEAHPELKGFIDEVIGTNKKTSSVMASAGFQFRKMPNGNYQKIVRLKVNKAMFSNYEDMDEAVQDMVTQHWQTPKSSYEGVINHEMGHMVAQRGLNQMMGVSPQAEFSYDLAETFTQAFKNRALERPIIEQSFKDVGIALTPENMQKYISEYGATNYAEAFAELYSDEDATSKLKEAFDKNLKLMTNALYQRG